MTSIECLLFYYNFFNEIVSCHVKQSPLTLVSNVGNLSDVKCERV